MKCPVMDYHVHTKWSYHGRGDVDECCQRALKLGIKELGFVDHFWNLSYKHGEFDKYVEDVERAKDEYKGRLNVRLGTEMDFTDFRGVYGKYTEKELDMLKHRDKWLEEYGDRMDYITCSVHYWLVGNKKINIGNIIKRDGRYKKVLSKYGAKKIVEDWSDTAIEGIETGIFDVVAHPYGFKWFTLIDYTDDVERLANTIRRHHVACELNKNRPGDRDLSIFTRKRVNFVLASDSHSPENVGKTVIDSMSKLRKRGVKRVTTFDHKHRGTLEI